MKKKIAILCISMKGGGAERVISILLNNLYKQYDFHLVLLQNEIDYDIVPHVKINILGCNNKNTYLNLLSLPALAIRYKKYCIKNDIDLSLSFLNRPNWINCLTKKMGWAGQVFISERSAILDYYRHSFGFLGRTLAFSLTKWLYPSADLVIPNSKGGQNQLETLLPTAVQYKTIYNPLDLNKISTLKNEEFDATFFGPFNFIYVARFHTGKNHLMLVEAFNDVQKDIPAKLILVGNGEEAKSVKKHCEDLGIAEKVVFIGFDDNPYKYLAKADCFVMPSQFEGFPNVIIEALACSLPVISTDCRSGPSEILSPDDPNSPAQKDEIKYAQYGVLTPVGSQNKLAEAMLEIYKNEKLRQQYVENSTKRAEAFRLEIFTNAIKQIFN